MQIANNSVAPTAWAVARERALSDIPYSKEIVTALKEVLNERGGRRV